jgi:hypothetical protein
MIILPRQARDSKGGKLKRRCVFCRVNSATATWGVNGKRKLAENKVMSD